MVQFFDSHCISVLFTSTKWHTQHCVAISATAELVLLFRKKEAISILSLWLSDSKWDLYRGHCKHRCESCHIPVNTLATMIRTCLIDSKSISVTFIMNYNDLTGRD